MSRNDNIWGLTNILNSLRGLKSKLGPESVEYRLLDSASDQIDAALVSLKAKAESVVQAPTIQFEDTQRKTYLTTDPTDPRLKEPETPGRQNDVYLVLSEEERKKGFQRPVRSAYRHVGLPRPKNALIDISAEEKRKYEEFGYVKFEKYPDGSSVFGRYWSQAQIDKIEAGCGAVTRMGRALSETYARNPSFYGATFCVGCGVHLPVGEHGEFVWEEDGTRVGT